MAALAWCLPCRQDMLHCVCMQQVNTEPSGCSDLEAYLFTALAPMPWARSSAAY